MLVQNSVGPSFTHTAKWSDNQKCTAHLILKNQSENIRLKAVTTIDIEGDLFYYYYSGLLVNVEIVKMANEIKVGGVYSYRCSAPIPALNWEWGKKDANRETFKYVKCLVKEMLKGQQ